MGANILNRTFRHDFPSAAAAFGTQINDPVAGTNNIRVMLNDDYRVAFVHELSQHAQQHTDIFEMQASRRFILSSSSNAESYLP